LSATKFKLSAVVIIEPYPELAVQSLFSPRATDSSFSWDARAKRSMNWLPEIGGTGRRAIALSIDLPEPVSVKRIADALAERQLDGTNLSIVPASACSALKLGPIGLSN
jgi:hypothetical protein